jgi:predicted transcriptional regulator
MFSELQGKKVKVFLNCSQWNEYSVSGEVVKSDELWIYLKGKKTSEIVSVLEIKRISIESE